MFLMPDNKWARLLAYVTGLVNQKLLLQNEYLAAEDRALVLGVVRLELGCLPPTRPTSSNELEVARRASRFASL